MFMSSRRTVFALGALLLGLGVFLATRTAELDAQVASSTEERDELGAAAATSDKERDALRREVSELSRRVAELERREAVWRTVPAEAPRRTAAEVPAGPPARPAAAEVQSVTPPPRVTTIAPAGWRKNGSAPGAYAVGVDQTQLHAGLPSAYVKSTEPSVDGFGGMMQIVAADEFVGKRLRYSAWVKTQDANSGGGHLWLRIDGNEGSILGFDNMDGRAVEGTTDWQHCSIVLDVPAGAAAYAYGFFVAGTGQMWVSGAKIEEVGPDVASTNMRSTQPQNLDFK